MTGEYDHLRSDVDPLGVDRVPDDRDEVSVRGDGLGGRGAWPNSGQGGTLNVDGDGPGPYYRLTAYGGPPYVGEAAALDPDADLDARAVRYGVISLQRRLQVLVDPSLRITGRFNPRTADAVVMWQRTRPDLTDWGGVGPQTAKSLFMRRLRTLCAHDTVVCGFISSESAWDPGAVGRVDSRDLGLGQINGGAHPDLTEAERFNATVAFEFTDNYLTRSLSIFDDSPASWRMIDAVVSYNLGVGGMDSHGTMVGARAWIAEGRPDVWVPPYQDDPRDIKGYYTRILTACEDTPQTLIGAAFANAAPEQFPLRVGRDGEAGL